MRAPVRTVLYGLAEPSQAVEAAQLGIDAVVVAVGEGPPPAVPPAAARRIAAALPPLVGRFAWMAEKGRRLPGGFAAAVVPVGGDRPPGAAVALARVPHEAARAERIPDWADGLWIEPAPRGSATATRFDFHRIERLARLRPVMLEIPDGAAGVEVAIRLGRPHGVVFGPAVWFRPGIVDLEKLERAVEVVTRLNRRLAEERPPGF
ncbi:MAG: hypothetical protein D6718_05835 [Acidobacteria bacterium]|nr:MAG: hypothetical protein D6718_05835 [Acidobacteriota bacterium]